MMKYLVIAFLIIAALVVAYFTFVVATIKIAFGGIMLGIAAIALLVVWIMWKSKD